MERLRRIESFDRVLHEGLFRGTSAATILASRGAIFAEGLPGLLGAGGFRPNKIPTKEEVLDAGAKIFDTTSPVEGVDVFISHRWGSPRWMKYLALCLHMNVSLAVMCSACTWALASAAVATIEFSSAAKVSALTHHLLFLGCLVYLPMLVFFVGLFFGHHAMGRLCPQSLWVDRACIHQTDHTLKQQQIQALPIFVSRSASMLVLWDEEYFQRLWCQLELGTFAKYGGAKKVQFLPLWLAPWFLSAQMLGLLGATGMYIFYVTDMQWAPSSQLTLTRTLADCMASSLWSLIAAPPLIIAFRTKLWCHAVMLEQMAAFDYRAAQCTLQSDRDLVEQQIQEVFRPHRLHAQDADESSMGWTACPSCDTQAATSLQSFNEYVKGPLRDAVLQSIGDELYVPYRLCLITGMPIAFLSSSDFLACIDETCLRKYGYSGPGAFLLSEGTGWTVAVFLLLPIFYPCCLRMLKCALSIPSQCLRLILVVLSVFLAFVYTYLQFDLDFDLLLLIANAEQGSEFAGWISLFCLLLVALMLQLKWLFNVEGPRLWCCPSRVCGHVEERSYRQLYPDIFENDEAVII